MIDHISIQVSDLAASTGFYDAVLAPLGVRRMIELGDVIAYGDERPWFWLGRATDSAAARAAHAGETPAGEPHAGEPHAGEPHAREPHAGEPHAGETHARETHLAFGAVDRAAVVAFHDAAVWVGAEVLNPPRVWPEYHPSYFGAFVRDPDGNNVEAVCHVAE